MLRHGQNVRPIFKLRDRWLLARQAPQFDLGIDSDGFSLGDCRSDDSQPSKSKFGDTNYGVAGAQALTQEDSIEHAPKTPEILRQIVRVKIM
jgi:hypothetical protein